MKKILMVLMALLISTVFAANRVGPVSQYGQLQAGKIPSGKTNAGHGRIFGSCPEYNQTPVQVRGMSLYWSLHSNATEFYNKDAISKMVRDMKIEIIRIPVGTYEPSWSNGAPAGFINDPNGQRALIDAVVQAAVQNDIYVIIDWHSHIANDQVSNAKSFFSEMAENYGSLDNVIFEIFNEPVCKNGLIDNNPNCNNGGYITWSDIKSYATAIIPEIRRHSDNLILVGTPKWDQQPNAVVGNAIDDENVAYTFHYYANTHHTYTEGNQADDAITRGLSVFVSEWGTGNADGGGAPDSSANDNWQKWMNARSLSSANWSASKISEGTAAFGSGSTYSYFAYTTSGNMVKVFLDSNPSSYTKCSSTPSSSSSGPTSSASSTVTLIDDFEDGNTTAETLEDSYWFLYTANGASITNTAPTTPDGPWDMIRSSSGNHYASMEGISIGNPADTVYPSAGMGLAFVEGSFENCTAIQYSYKGSGHYFRADMSSITPNKGYEHVTANQDKAESWTKVTVNASNLIQPLWVRQDASLSSQVKVFSWNEVYQLVWVFDKSIASAQRMSYLQIDSVMCVGTLPEVVIASSGSNPSSASSAASSSPSSAGSSSTSSAASSSPSSVASSSTSVATPFIDDFEDGDNMAFTGLNDYWYAFTDKGDKGASTISNAINDDGDYVVVFGTAAAGNSEYGAGLKNIALSKGKNEYDPYVTLGVNLEDGLAGCTAISYKYKGAGHNLKAVTRGDEEGDLSGYNYHKKAFEGSSSWTTASVSVPNGLKQEANWGTSVDLAMDNVVQLQWEVKKTATHEYLYIDDLKCEGMSIVPVVRPEGDSSDVDNSSSSRSRVRSSSSRSSGNEDGEEDEDDTDGIMGRVVAHSGLSAAIQGNTLLVSVARAGAVKVQVFDMMGHTIERHSENMTAGSFAHTFGNMGKGAYIVRVQQGSAVKTIRMQVR